MSRYEFLKNMYSQCRRGFIFKVVLPYSLVGVGSIDKVVTGMGGECLHPYPLPAATDCAIHVLERGGGVIHFHIILLNGLTAVRLQY